VFERARVWPDFRPEWILHEDDDLVFVDKPSGIPTQAADPEEPDDLVTRLSRHLRARGDAGYLGVHQRLDKDTSGVIVFAKNKDVNAHLAKVFEGRRAKKVYFACISTERARGGLLGVRGATLDDVIDGKPARSRVAVLKKNGSRALVSVAIETGRTHQVRVQLEKRGAPVAGDPLYGGERAPRLLLHAHELAFEHPRLGTVRVTAPTPPELDAWLAHGDLGDAVYDDPRALDRALRLALERRFALGRSEHTSAFRLVNEDGDALPRLAIDVYDEWLVMQLYGSDERGSAATTRDPWADLGRRERVLDAVAQLGFSGVYLKLRPKQSNELVDTRREDLAPKLPVRGTAAPSPFVIKERDMPLFVKLGDGLSTGVFLDQRKNRGVVRSLAKGARVLNLFAYTCPFTVAAAMGGAEATVSVDASPSALEWGMKNVLGAVGESEKKKHAFVAMDAFAYLDREARRGARFDVVIVDPPSYSSTKKRRFSAASDYPELLAAAMAVTAPNGQLVACCNHRGIAQRRFRKMAFDAGRLARRDVAQAKDLPGGADYPTAPGAEPFLKSMLIRLGS
jgi:23S rRNA (cytosine1962-C5)-methyltransferase